MCQIEVGARVREWEVGAGNRHRGEGVVVGCGGGEVVVSTFDQ